VTRGAGVALLALAVLAASAGAPARAEQFLHLYGGWALNDEATGADDTGIYGVRWGAESPVGGGAITLDVNRDGDTHMDSLYVSALLNIVSENRRLKDGRVLANGFSTFVSVGAGATRLEHDREDADDHTFLVFEYGLGLQYRLTPLLGLRMEALALHSPSGDFRNLESTAGLSFSW
jgi:hypothetical protein